MGLEGWQGVGPNSLIMHEYSWGNSPKKTYASETGRLLCAVTSNCSIYAKRKEQCPHYRKLKNITFDV